MSRLKVKMEGSVKHLWKFSTFAVSMLLALAATPVLTSAQISKVQTVWVILMENHNWTGNNAGAAFGAPDIKGNLLAPYANGQLLVRYVGARGAVFQPSGEPSQPAELSMAGSGNQLRCPLRHPTRPAPTQHTLPLG
jgi:hypothetical protein